MTICARLLGLQSNPEGIKVTAALFFTVLAPGDVAITGTVWLCELLAVLLQCGFLGRLQFI